MSEEPSRAPSQSKPRFIAGVHNYCDAWCERCPCQSRCRLYYNRLRYEAAARGEPAPPEEDAEDESRGTAPAEWLALLEEGNREPTAAELAAVTKEEAR